MGCETIYAFIYRAGQQAEQLWRYLTRRHKRRRLRRSRPSQDTIKDRISIHERPQKVDTRTEGGHWEGDLIICKRTRPVLVLHERKSRVTLAARLAGKTAAETISVMLAVFARIEPALRKSITSTTIPPSPSTPWRAGKAARADREAKVDGSKNLVDAPWFRIPWVRWIRSECMRDQPGFFGERSPNQCAKVPGKGHLNGRVPEINQGWRPSLLHLSARACYRVHGAAKAREDR